MLDDGSAAYVLTDADRAGGGRATDVVVNTTAVDLGLGTGGWHVVHWNLARDAWSGAGGGHVMKLRYTSCRPTPARPRSTSRATPTSACPTSPACPWWCAACTARWRAWPPRTRPCRPARRLVYVMTDGGALPLALSDLVADLRHVGLIDATVTAGHAFGGDHEAVNVPSALRVAVAVAGADAVVVAMGPGGVGTGTVLGATALEVAPALDVATALGGRAVAALRFSLADARAAAPGREPPHPHRRWPCAARPGHAGRARRARTPSAILARPGGRRSRTAATTSPWSTRPTSAACSTTSDWPSTTMGRGPADDPGFFAVAGAAGVAASVCGDGKVRCLCDE